ncbi:hypothetical protein TNCV_1948891 [Trichonephila clavipes]|nr:hypothetical protein TNCV_1948891 [Trichonephila clavipes]
MLHSAVAGFATRLEWLLSCGGGHAEHILVSSSCASASSSNAKELHEQILEVKINPQEKNTVSDTSTNKDTLSKEKESSRKMKTKKQN